MGRIGRLALVLALVACALLVVAEFTDLYSIRVITVTKKTAEVGAHHGYALLLVAVAAAFVAVVAQRTGSGLAAAALLALGVVALVIVLTVDLPVLDDTGVYGRDYESATAETGIGFKLETAGAVLLLFSAVTMVAFRPSAATAGR